MLLVFLLGVAVVAAALTSAVLTLVLPRGTRDFLTHIVFRFNVVALPPADTYGTEL